MIITFKNILIIITVLCTSSLFSQRPQEEEKLVRISKEVWVGVTAHTDGFGLNYNTAKFKTYKSKSLLNIELIRYLKET